MRTTLTLDADVTAKARLAMVRTELPFKTVINQALRLGLEQVLAPPAALPYRTEPRAMGLKPGLSYDDISELLAVSEGDKHR